MIPNNKILDEYIESNYIYENYEEDLRDKQPGNLDLQKPTESPTYQMWEMYYEDNIIKLKSLTTNKNYNIKTIPNVTRLSFSFTLNMNLTYAYTKSNLVHLNYYDTTLQSNVEVIFEEADHPTLVYDDLRETQNNFSDILFLYINKSSLKLCYRLLRDRYTIEYELYDLPKHTKIVRVGMADNFRLKFKLKNYN